MPKRKGGRPTLESATALRENLLARALDIFLEKGYGGASLNQIAKYAGVSRDTIYRQFSDKKELFLAASGSAFSAMAGHLDDVIRLEDPPEKVLEKVIRYIHLDTRDDQSNSVIRLTIMEAYRFPELREEMLPSSFRFVQPLISYLKYQAARGALYVGDAAETALLISVAAAGGGSFFMQSHPDDESEAEVRIRRILDFVLYGLKPRPPDAPA